MQLEGGSLYFHNFLKNQGIGKIRRCLSKSGVSLPLLLCIIESRGGVNANNLLIVGGGVGGPDFIPTRTTKRLGSHVQILCEDDEHTSW